jgi:MFS family permease
MTTDLNFPPNGLSVATSVFYASEFRAFVMSGDGMERLNLVVVLPPFPAYILFEVPFTTMLRTVRPSRLIPGVVIIWGGVVLGSGFANNYATVIATRLLLGMMEAALTPCLMVYLTTFYQRNELGLRMCYLFISAAISGVVGGLIVSMPAPPVPKGRSALTASSPYVALSRALRHRFV